MHTVMDRTSPAHVGNQPWNGTEGWRNKLAAAEHFRRESYATDAERAAGIPGFDRFRAISKLAALLAEPVT